MHTRHLQSRFVVGEYTNFIVGYKSQITHSLWWNMLTTLCRAYKWFKCLSLVVTYYLLYIERVYKVPWQLLHMLILYTVIKSKLTHLLIWYMFTTLHGPRKWFKCLLLAVTYSLVCVNWAYKVSKWLPYMLILYTGSKIRTDLVSSRPATYLGPNFDLGFQWLEIQLQQTCNDHFQIRLDTLCNCYFNQL